MNNQILFGIAVVPSIIGLVQVAKTLGVPSTFAPALAVIFGVAAGLAQLYGSNWPWVQAIVIGIALGLSACGLYSGAQVVATKLNPSDPQPIHITEVPPPTAQ